MVGGAAATSGEDPYCGCHSRQSCSEEDSLENFYKTALEYHTKSRSRGCRHGYRESDSVTRIKGPTLILCQSWLKSEPKLVDLNTSQRCRENLAPSIVFSLRDIAEFRLRQTSQRRKGQQPAIIGGSLRNQILSSLSQHLSRLLKETHQDIWRLSKTWTYHRVIKRGSHPPKDWRWVRDCEFSVTALIEL